MIKWGVDEQVVNPRKGGVDMRIVGVILCEVVKMFLYISDNYRVKKFSQFST